MYTRSEFLDAIQTAESDVQGYLSRPKYHQWAQQRDRPHPSTITKRFDSWDDAREAAGLEMGGPTGSPYSEEDLLAAVRRAARDCEGYLSLSTYEDWASGTDAPCSVTLMNRLDCGWDQIRERAGVRTDPRPGEGNHYPDDYLLENLRSADAACEGTLSQPKYTDWAEGTDAPAPTTISARFGGWYDACRQAGIWKPLTDHQ